MASAAVHSGRPVAVQLTAVGTGAIAVILLAGEGAAAVIGNISGSSRAEELSIGRFIRANLRTAAGELLDDGLIVRTGEDRFEVHLHGGVAVAEAVLSALQAAGAEKLTAVEAQARGILGKGIESETQVALPLAVTITGAKLLLAQPQAQWSWIEKWRRHLAGGGPLWVFQSAAQWLLERPNALDRLLKPPRVAIIGPPNAGKSTLANALLGRPASITSNIAGTTRDWVDAQAVLVGDQGVEVPVTLVDTAGLRETADPLERESIARTHAQAATADVIVALFDITQPLSDEASEWLRHCGGRAVVVFNKIDLAPAQSARRSGEVNVSAKTHSGLDRLMTAVVERLDLHVISENEVFAFSARQRKILKQAAAAGDAHQCVTFLDAWERGF